MADWAKIKAEYIRDQSASYRKLAKKYNVSRGVLEKTAKREKWVELRGQKVVKAAAAVVDACATKEAEKAIRIYEVADALLDRIKAKIAEGDLDSKDMRSLSGALRDIAAVKGLQTEADKREQEARIAKLRREAEKGENENSVEFIVPDELQRFCK